jgi:hypothetical protein
MESESLVTVLLSSFPGRRDVYAEQGRDGAWFPVREPLDERAVRDHLAGTRTVGSYPVVENAVRLICWDIDEPDAEKARAQARRIARILVIDELLPIESVAVEFSGRKGYHVWLFLAEPVPVLDAREYGRHIAERAGVPHVEVFPKGEVRDGGLGNLVKMPLALHRVSGRRSCFVDGRWSPVEDAEAFLRMRRPLPAPIFDARLRRVRAARPASRPPGTGARPAEHSGELLPCADHILTYGEGEGARNHALYALACAAKRAGLSREHASSLVEQAAGRCSPPVPLREAATTAASAYRTRGVGFDCTAGVLHAGAVPHCVRTCPRYRSAYGAAR